MIRATFFEGKTYYIVVPSDTSQFGNIVAAVEKNGSDYTISHACKQNIEAQRCEHTDLAESIIQSWNVESAQYSIQYKREEVRLNLSMIQI